MSELPVSQLEEAARLSHQYRNERDAARAANAELAATIERSQDLANQANAAQQDWMARAFRAERQRDQLRGLLSQMVNTQHLPTCFRFRPDPACPRCEAVRDAFKELSQ